MQRLFLRWMWRQVKRLLIAPRRVPPRTEPFGLSTKRRHSHA